MKVENTNIKNLFRHAGGFAALFFMFSTEAVAQEKPEPAKQTMHVQFLMEQDGFLVFKAVINSKSEKKQVLKISDGSKDLVYSEVIRVSDYSRIFKFPKIDENGEIEFQLTDGNEIFRKSFSVGTKTEEVFVVREKN